MKIEVTKKAMVAALKKVGRCSEKKNIEHSRIVELNANYDNKLILKKNNFENYIVSAIGATIMEKGSVVVQYQELMDIVSLMPDGQLNLTLNNELIVKKGTTIMSLPVQTQPFTNWKNDEVISEIILPEVTFKKLIEKVIYSADDKVDKSSFMSSVNIELKDDMIRMTATNGKKLATASEKIESTGENYICMIPASQLEDISALLSELPGDTMSFIIRKNSYQLKVTDKRIVIAGRFVRGTYPTIINNVLTQKTKNLIDVDREELYKAVERASYVSKKGERCPLILDINGSLKLSTNNKRNSVEDEIFCRISGDKMRIGVDPAYMKEMLKNYPDERVRIGYDSPKSPIFLYTDNTEQTFVVFPVMIR